VADEEKIFFERCGKKIFRGFSSSVEEKNSPSAKKKKNEKKMYRVKLR
jgi:hypothetical protein